MRLLLISEHCSSYSNSKFRLRIFPLIYFHPIQRICFVVSGSVICLYASRESQVRSLQIMLVKNKIANP
ncbi:hypothetical protein SUGI_0117510 [Cryptomeria japonica]|nr:hypothetical protein SUGI_0117510 [Cryptomeria japonica]